MNFRIIIVLIVVNSIAHNASSQWDEERPTKTLLVKEANDEIILDGKLNERSWKLAEIGTEFWQIWPTDSLRAKAKTEVKITYDDKFIYVGAKMYSFNDEPYIIKTLRRDFQGPEIDGFHVNFDTFFDQTNAVNFAVNPLGVQREGQITNGGNGRIDVSWDNKWFSEVRQYDGYWIAEMAIPFKTIRYKEGVQKWGFNSFRLDGNANERVAWSPVPQNFSLASLAFDGELIFDKPLKKPGANVALIPYTAGGVTNNFEENTGNDATFDIGGDAKIGLTPGLNLDLTINPDFSQVEVDRQQTNITRFELFFPERRQFFLENADLFSDFGGMSTRPFFSRRIGILTDTATDLTIQNKIRGGLRLNGKLDENWRIGLLSMQAAANDKNGQPSFNYGMAVIQRKVLSNSTVSAFIVNKQDLFSDDDEEYAVDLDHYNRVAGAEYNFRSANGQWRSSGFFHKSFTHDLSSNGQHSAGYFINYQKRKFEIFNLYREVGDNFTAEVGFVPRKNFRRSFTSAEYNIYPSSGFISSHGPSLEYAHWFKNTEFTTTDQFGSFGYEFDFVNQMRFSAEVTVDYTLLQEDFDPSDEDDSEPLAELTDYTYTRFLWRFGSNQRKEVFFELNGSVGQFFNGKIVGVDGSVSYRLQPLAIFSVDYNYNRIRLPEPHGDANLFLIGPKLDFTFTRKLFLTGLAQYNSQLDNINLNVRFQWRYKPVSDFYLVYTDNYFASPFLEVRNRALVFKMTYWLNL
ncbi:MAG: DUF5916 domain-containing protein [Cyclobacteriaceae bacterium]